MKTARWFAMRVAAFAMAAFAMAAAQAQAQATYDAATTYEKLAPAYPFIRIARAAPPADVRLLADIAYARRGDHALQLDVYRPVSAPALSALSAPPLPAIVLVHGGGWRVGTRAEFAPMAIRMARRGYVAVTVSYRLSPEAAYPAAVLDIKAALRFVRAHAAAYGIDPNRIAIAGGSAGGQIAALVGTTNGDARFDDAAPDAASSAVQAIVNIDGLSDFTSEAARRYEDDPAKQPSSAGAWFGGRYAERSAVWHDASPLFHVSAATPPTLFIGSAQPRFSLGREAMVERLNALGVPNQVVLLPGTPHSFWMFDPWLDPTVDATVAFLDAHLR